MVPDDAHIAAVLALGVRTGFARRADLIAWADREIEARPEPPPWIIELAMSHSMCEFDLRDLLEPRAAGVAPDAAVRLAFALVPDPPTEDFAAAKRLATEMFNVSLLATNLPYHDPMLRDLNGIESDFDIFEYSGRSATQLMRDLADYLRRFRDDDVRARLAPVAWVGPVRV